MGKIPIIIMTLLFLTPLIAGCTVPHSDTGKEIANKLSTEIKLTGPLDSSIFDDFSKFQDWVGHINTIIGIMNEELHTKIPDIGSSSSDYEQFKRLLKYSPLIGSYNNLYNSAILLPSDNDSDYTNF